MPADIHDANQLPAILVTQASPNFYASPGALTSAAQGGSPLSKYIATPVTIALSTNSGGPSGTYQLSTQDNNTPGQVPQIIWAGKVPYSQAEAGLVPAVNGVVRS